MNKTYGDMMSECESARETVKRFGTWNSLDTLVEELISQLVSKPMKQNANWSQQQRFGFDDMGAVVDCGPFCGCAACIAAGGGR